MNLAMKILPRLFSLKLTDMTLKRMISSSITKQYCSDSDQQKSKFAKRYNYEEDCKNIYDSNGLFQQPGPLRLQQFSQDYHSTHKQTVTSEDKLRKDEETEDIETEKASKYYEQYYKMFNTVPQCDAEKEEANVQVNYYEEYRKAFQSAISGLEKEPHLTHTDRNGQINMVDVGYKPETSRVATATGKVHLGSHAYPLVVENNLKKGDVITTAKIAGIMACKNTGNLIPLCHPLAINKVNISMEYLEHELALLISCEVHTKGKTGVEMEALMGVSIAALTVYDMCKAVTHDITITDIQLLHKSGGLSGDFYRAK